MGKWTKQLEEVVTKNKAKIIVLDDDPTGVQTVHDVSVYTDWNVENIRKGFLEQEKIFFILTNSRGFTMEETTKAHREIAERVLKVAKELQQEYLIVSRSDSTLRGHYPLETEILHEAIRDRGYGETDGEILCPFFKEGGRLTIEDVHYVLSGGELIPAGETEFAKDETFGYHASNLREYVEEKTKGKYRAESCLSIPLKILKTGDIEAVENILIKCSNFQKIIVNATEEEDLEVFCIALYHAIAKGKHFLFRCAASLVKVLGGISSQPLLTREQMIKGMQIGLGEKENGGIIVVGSHTEKTTKQLEKLKEISEISFLEMNSDLVLNSENLLEECRKLQNLEEKLIGEGETVCISTKRQLLRMEDDKTKKMLKRSVRISEALQSCVGNLKYAPAFVVAKGGITSSDVGIKALRVRHARVLGQIQPGIPVWETGEESLFPGIPYIIFPGNVGEEDTLKKVAEILLQDQK